MFTVVPTLDPLPRPPSPWCHPYSMRKIPRYLALLPETSGVLALKNCE